jgi:hypothetical protein
MLNEECAAIHWQPHHGNPPGFPPAGERYADELFELWGSAEQIEAHMESEGYSDDEIFVQLRRLGLRRVYVREACSPA